MDQALRQLVRQRAGERCEYCRMLQSQEPFYRFHVEHIIPRQHEGSDDQGNLALSCHHCNLHKGPNLTAIDPGSGQIVPLFDARHQEWNEHFAVQESRVVGVTPTGRATVRLLQMNAVSRVELRCMTPQQ